ncbi:vacuolar amino acid transporter 4 [Monosporozyma unispora]
MSSRNQVPSINIHAGERNITSNDTSQPMSIRSQNIQVPQHKRNVSYNAMSQSLASRRSSVRRGSFETGSFCGPSSLSNNSKRLDPQLMMNIKSPNFRTSNGQEEEEILNSVKENYLTDHLKKSDRSLLSSPHSHDAIKTSSSIDDPNLQRPAGDMTRDIYKLATQTAPTRKPKTLEDIQLTSESNRRKSTASGLNVPGGFRREYIVNKIRTERDSSSSFLFKNNTDYGSIRTIRASENPFESDAENNDDDNDEDVDDLENVPFLTRNFLEFLYIYGHFAGESFEDDFFSEDMVPTTSQDNGALMPMSSKAIKAQMSAVKGTASTKKVFLLLLKSFIGTGVLFLPKAFSNGGLFFSMGMLVFFGIYSYWCYYILVKAKEMTKVSSFGDIGLQLYGPWLRVLILFALGSTQIGFAGAYMIFTGKNLAAFIENVFHININLSYVMIFQLLVFVPISFIRNVSKLSFPALISNFCILFGLIIIVIFMFKHWIIDLGLKPMGDIIYGINSDRWSLFVGTAIFAFEGIGLIIPVQQSMKSPELFPKVLRSVIFSVTILFIGMGSIGYIVYGSNVETVILLNLPQQSVFVNIIQLLYSFAIMLSTPLQLFPAIKIIEDKFFPKFIKIYGDKSMGDDPSNVSYRLNSGRLDWKVKWWKNLVRSIIVTLVVTYAYYGIDYLDQVVAIVGSFCCLPLVYVIPPMLHLRCYTSGLATHNIDSKTKLIIWFDYFLIIFGLISMLYTSYQSIVVS